MHSNNFDSLSDSSDVIYLNLFARIVMVIGFLFRCCKLKMKHVDDCKTDNEIETETERNNKDEKKTKSVEKQNIKTKLNIEFV